MGIVTCLVPSTRDNDRFIDAYVLIFPALPLLLLTLVPYFPILTFVWPIAAWRIFEIVVSLLNTLLFDEYRLALRFERPKPLAGVRRPLILLAFSYAELVLWFAFIYRFLLPPLHHPGFEAWISAINFSFVNLSAFGSSPIQVKSTLAMFVTLLEAALGLFMALAAISRFVSLIPERSSADPVERRIKR